MREEEKIRDTCICDIYLQCALCFLVSSCIRRQMQNWRIPKGKTDYQLTPLMSNTPRVQVLSWFSLDSKRFYEKANLEENKGLVPNNGYVSFFTYPLGAREQGMHKRSFSNIDILRGQRFHPLPLTTRNLQHSYAGAANSRDYGFDREL